MAAAVSSVWAKPGAWALEAEEHEAELKQQQAPPTSNQKSTTTTGDSSDFPSLAAAATTKTKKKKGQTISLAEFATYGVPKPDRVTERLTQAELVSLPTGPRERSAEELDRSKLGGGFRSHGSDSRWGPSRVSEDGERRSRDRESNRDLGPSRADENDDWAATKKPVVSERRERSGGFFDSSQSQSSKADEVDSWVSSKPKFVSSSNGGGDRFEKRGSFESLSRNRDSSDSDSWGRRREESVGGEGGASRPRLVLQPRTLPVPVVEVRPESPVNVVPVERPKGVNPFGSARPREEVLAEKGQDYKEIDEKLEADKLKDIGFGIGNGRKDEHTVRSWRKSPEQSEEGAKEEEPSVEDDANKEEATKEEANNKEEAINEEEAEKKN